MKKRKVYIFNRASRAAAYGIGTYIEQYIKCFKDSSLDFGIINLSDKNKEVQIEKKNGYQEIWIPSPGDPRRPENNKNYARNAVYLLKDIIGQDKNTEYIFHLNFMGDHQLVYYLKKMFQCKVVLVTHYAGWDFALNGDNKKLQKILADKSLKRKDKHEADILNEIQTDKKTILESDHFVCVSQYMLDLFKKTMDIGETPYSVVHNALQDTYKDLTQEEKTAIRLKYHIAPDTKLLLYAGRLDPMKGISYLLDAFRKVLEQDANVQLIMAGDGDYNRWMKEAGDCWSKISFTGRLDKEQLYDLYNIADMGLVTSMCEPFGLVAIEMMMHGLPVIASDAGGLTEIIDNDVSGLRVPIIEKKGERKLDTDVLTEKIELLLNNPELRKRIGANGREKFLEQYELSVFKENMMSVYNK
ncbi:MAG: TIGR04157 family glycosyltransferase [Prevotella sp.]|jgi:glycosyltransferase|nr:TIGR04157 family glycosyltransferase [Prevotella sp.]